MRRGRAAWDSDVHDRGRRDQDAAADRRDDAVSQLWRILDAFVHDDLALAMDVEPLEQVIDNRKEELRTHHILRLQQGECSIGAGFVWTDLLTGLARTSDHCSNIAGCIIDQAHNNMNIHESIRGIRNGSQRFRDKFDEYSKKYALN